MAEQQDDFGVHLFDAEDRENGYSEESGLKESTIILIDCQPAMWEPCSLPDKSLAGKTWLQASIAGAASVVRQRALEGGLDDVALYFYNFGNPAVLETARELGFSKVNKVLNLESPSAQRVRKIERLNPNDLGAGSSAPFDRTSALTNALRAAFTGLPGLSKLKGEGGVVSYGAQRVMVLTRDDDPTGGGADDASGALDKAKSIGLKGGTLELVPLVGIDGKFDLEPFWAAMLNAQTSATSSALASQIQTQAAPFTPSLEEDDRIVSFRSLSAFVRARASRKRALARMLWDLGQGGPTLGVKLYASLRPATRGQIVYFSNDRVQVPLVRSTGVYDDDTGTMLESTDRPRKFHPKEATARLTRVFVTAEELRDIKAPAMRGMELVGFRPRAALAPWHQLSPSAFLRPDEGAVSGSALLFASILDECLEKDRIAVASLVRGISAEPILVALMPQAEERDPASGAQLAPPGFHIITLPYLEDVRDPERDPTFTDAAGPAAAADPAATAAVDALIDSIRLDNFDSTALRNPLMQQFFAVLEAAALGQTVPSNNKIEDVDDMLTQQGAAFPEALATAFTRAVCVGKDWNEGHLHGDVVKASKAPAKEKESKKRAAPEAGGEGQGYTDEELAGMDLNAFAVPQLKELVKVRGIGYPKLPKFKKADLIAHLKAHLPGGSGG